MILPQAIARVLAPLASNSLELVKTTSIAALVAMPELLRSARVAQEQTYNPTPLTAAAMIFFVLLWPFARWVAEARARHDHEAEMKRLVGKTALDHRRLLRHRPRHRAQVPRGRRRAPADGHHRGGASKAASRRTRSSTSPFFQGDVSREADVEEAVRRAAAPRNRLDILVNDAVVRSGKKLTDTSLEEWNRVHGGERHRRVPDVPCRHAPACCRQEIRSEVRGRIVNISSQHGMIASPERLRLRRLQGRRSSI